MDWDYYIDINFPELNNDSKEELCSQLSKCQVDAEATDEELKKVFALAQKLLQFRGNQIEEIKNEHAATIEKIRQEYDELENQASSSKRARKASEAKQEAARLSKQNKELLAELEVLRRRNKGKDPMMDTEEDEYRAEKEKQKMKKTVELQTEHIGSLLSDLENTEAENASLKQHLSNLRDKLAEATEALAETSADLTNSQKINLELKNRFGDSKDEIESLRRQISELVEQRSLLDSQLLQFQHAMESRVDTWKNLMEKKDGEISELRQQVLFSRPEQYAHLQETVSALTQSMAIRDQQVNELSTRLSEATKDLEESTEALEKLRSNKGDGESRKLWQQLQRAVKRERTLESRIEEAERDALIRGEQVTELSTQIQKLEQGEFGLPEALAESREMKRNLAVRDAEIARLIKTTNQLQASLDEIADQNLALRERFGIADEEVDISGVRDRRASERQRIESLLKQVAGLEQEKVTLKLQLREARKGKGVLDQDDKQSLQRESEQIDFKLIVEENESLRKGMHEILESIRNQDANSDVHLESNCLERLLEALDSRHVAGWYHPAMRLQAQLHNVQGVASELREQLRISREQENLWKQQVGSLLEQNIGSAATSNTNIGPSNLKRTNFDFQPQKQLHQEWKSKMHTLQDDLKGLFKEVSKSLPLIAHSRKEHDEELSAKMSDLEGSIEEYKRHLEEENHSVAVCAAKCATQRIAERFALRKCHGLEAARKRLSEDLENKSVEAIKCEAKLEKEIANLRENEVLLRNENNKLAALLESCVPADEFRSTQQELAKTSEALRKCLLDTMRGTDDSKAEQNHLEKIAQLETQVKNLVQELEKDKACLHVLQAQEQFPDVDQQVQILAQKISALEVNEAVIAKKAEHAEKMYQLAKAQVIELENEKREFEQMLSQQYSIKDLELPIMQQKQNVEIREDFAKIEKLETSLVSAQKQIESLQNLQNNRNFEMDAMRELNQELQSSGDLQATLGRMTEDILALRLESENLKFKLQESDKKELQQQRRSVELDVVLNKLQKELIDRSVELHKRERNLKGKLVSICSRHTACVPLSTFELATRWLNAAREDVEKLQNQQNELNSKLDCIELEREKLKLECSETENKNSQPEQLQEWHTRNVHLRIKELESSRKAEKLEKECEELKCQVLNLKNHARSLEDERLALEKNWEQRLMLLEYEKYVDGGGGFVKPAEEKSKEPDLVVEELDAAREQSKEKHPNKKFIRRGTFTSLNDNVDVLKKELQMKEDRISHLERMMDGQQGDSRAKLALEAMVASLSELVSLKEGAVTRARQRLKEANDDNSEMTRELRRQLIELQNSMAKLQGSRVMEQVSPEISQGPTITKLLTQVHTLEDEIRVSNHSAATLAGQLRSVSSEMQRWKDLAEARQTKLQAIQDRYEEEVSQAIVSRLSSSSRVAEKSETEMSEKELTSTRTHPELQRSRQEVDNLREMVAQMQEQIKKLQSKVSERRRSQSSPREKTSKILIEPAQRIIEKPPMQPRFDNSKAAAIIGKLQTQVKQLQEEIDTFKTREQIYLDQSKAKTSEVVSRWEERKNLQAKCDKLKQKLDESEATAKKLKESNQALRALIERLEREKILLDQQLRRKSKAVNIIAQPAPIEAQMSKMRMKLASSEEECASLRRQLEHHKRVSEDVPRLRAELATLRGKYETQREAAVQMQSKIARLEAANLELNLKIDDLVTSDGNGYRGDSSDDGGMSKEELQRSVLMLGQHVRKLQEKLRDARDNGSAESASAETSQKLQSALRRKLSLENEVSQLKRERSELCSQLNQKVKILVEVRAALQEASLREAALKSEVAHFRRSPQK
ncbi:centrosomal protein of 290 kDa-like [Neocloeon triangulifer]|uniref:centrosomal protein of 290 kDa-like n=1 Tax=Neocloeon triangulifer TaxID=2078957 RepID=UPI00286F7F20|nr:centrosomal protein of 290 kDa-like [Neocloeon triangulifer]